MTKTKAAPEEVSDNCKIAIEDAIRRWAVRQPVSVAIGLGTSEIEDLAQGIITGLKDAGITVRLEDGTEYEG